jgi:hypothetical protein
MKVYLVSINNCEPYEDNFEWTQGIYSSVEKAEKYLIADGYHRLKATEECHWPPADRNMWEQTVGEYMPEPQEKDYETKEEFLEAYEYWEECDGDDEPIYEDKYIAEITEWEVQ